MIDAGRWLPFILILLIGLIVKQSFLRHSLGNCWSFTASKCFTFNGTPWETGIVISSIHCSQMTSHAHKIITRCIAIVSHIGVALVCTLLWSSHSFLFLSDSLYQFISLVGVIASYHIIEVFRLLSIGKSICKWSFWM